MNTTGVKNGIEFENRIRQSFLYGGVKAITTPTSNDYGSDLIIEYEDYTFSAQCKFYTKPVGIKAVQEVMGSLKYYGADFGMVITNSTFTQQAKNLARTNNILLIDGEESLEYPKQILSNFLDDIKDYRPFTTEECAEWTIDDLVIRYGVSKGTILKNFLSAGLPFSKVGREYRFSEDEVIEWEVEKRSIPYRKDQSIMLPGYKAYIKLKHDELEKAKASGDKEKVAALKQDLREHGQPYIEWWVWLVVFVPLVIIAAIIFALLFVFLGH